MPVMDKPERLALVKVIGDVVREYVSGALRSVSDRIDDFDRRLNALPPPGSGPKGDPGELGPMGPPGPAGESTKGDPGERGTRGESMYEIALRAGFTGTEAEWLASLRGKDGERGERGPEPDTHAIRTLIAHEVAKAVAAIPAPKDGADGMPGRDGESVHRDSVAMMIVDEVRKHVAAIQVPAPVLLEAKAAEYVPGPPGPPGVDGRDALQVDVLPAVDLTRSYPRATYATHEGGEIRAFRATTPGEATERNGWEVARRGIAGVEFTKSEDGREFGIRLRLTGGDVVEETRRIPAMLYRGVFRAGEAYEPGDVCTWDGSAWHCQASTKEAPRNDGPGDWKLMVKHGRPGKDGKDGEKGAQGAEGRAGKDLTQLGPDGRKW